MANPHGHTCTKVETRRELHLVLYAHRSTHAQTQECVHRHVSRNIVHKAAHMQTLVLKQTHRMLCTYVYTHT